ncbi:hypothetical protein [Nocardia callitridis]|uniref:Uncharacterized protein n=1 Tax=Nocardia callitridis TaxID=648753 RepID=A0ABP9K7F6_9NOCA
MSELAITIVVVVGSLALLGVVFWLLPWLLDRPVDVPGAVPVDEILKRGCHAAPEAPYSVEQAHRVMQVRIDCDTATCAAKHAAFWTVVDAGRATPDPRVER